MRAFQRAAKTAVFVFLVVTAVAEPRAWSEPFDSIPPRPEMKLEIPKGTPEPCAGIAFSYHERIEQQTLLGFIPDFLRIATPAQHNRNVERAVFNNVYFAWEAHKLRTDPEHYDYNKYEATVPYGLRPAFSPLQLMGFDFRLRELCHFAKKKGVQRLTFACGSDVVTESHEYVKDPEKLSQSRNPDAHYHYSENDWVTTDCFLSTHPKAGASWKELKRHRWGDVFSRVEFSSDGDAVLESDEAKQTIYTPLLRRVVSSAVLNEIEPIAKPKPKPTAMNTGVSHCVQQSDATPSIRGVVSF